MSRTRALELPTFVQVTRVPPITFSTVGLKEPLPTVMLAFAMALQLGRGVGLGEALGLGETPGLGEALGLGDALGLGETPGLGEALGEGLGLTPCAHVRFAPTLRKSAATVMIAQ